MPTATGDDLKFQIVSESEQALKILLQRMVVCLIVDMRKLKMW